MGGGGKVKTPDYAAAAAEGIRADIENYPMRYLVDAAARMGGKVTIGGKTYDFTGLGAADTAGVMSDQMAATLLDIQRNYGADYVKQSLADLKQADPRGYAARKQLFDAIIAQTEAEPNRPLAEGLQRSILSELQQAGRLDARQLSEVQQAVRGGQVARGNYLGSAATAQEAAAAVRAGETLRDQRQAAAQGFLQSGVTPEDVQYRRLQQSLANLGAFAGGTTPTAQFRQLAAAGNAAAPVIGTAGSNIVTNPNAAQLGLNRALAIYAGNVNWAEQQVNPWMAGLSTGFSALGTFGAMGGFGGGGGGGAGGGT